MNITIKEPLTAPPEPRNILQDIKFGQWARAKGKSVGLDDAFLLASGSEHFTFFRNGYLTYVSDRKWLVDNYFAEKILPVGTEINLVL
jgi:hypothetical protein